jgi:hypothetical protein
LDVKGVQGAFIVNDAGELLFVRFAAPSPEAQPMNDALDAVDRLRVAESSGLDAVSSVVRLPLGLLFTRRLRGAHLCALATRQPDLKGLEMAARLVARALPKNSRLEDQPAQVEGDADERLTQPWDRQAAEGGELTRSSLRPPRVPRELVGQSFWPDSESQSGSGSAARPSRVQTIVKPRSRAE